MKSSEYELKKKTYVRQIEFVLVNQKLRKTESKIMICILLHLGFEFDPRMSTGLLLQEHMRFLLMQIASLASVRIQLAEELEVLEKRLLRLVVRGEREWFLCPVGLCDDCV